MKILSIDTSCDETAVAITSDLQIFSNKIWSQSSLHANFGGVMPSLAQRQHEERIDFVVDSAIKNSGIKIDDIEAVAVTVGPGLGIALGVGINKAKEIAKKYKLPLIPINHVEAHLLSPFARPSSINSDLLTINYPSLGLVLSGGTTELILVKSVGEYEILAETGDDALGEALDKAARLLGFGYPGGTILEKIAKLGKGDKYKLPIPLINDVIKNRFSYSGLKTALVRLFSTVKNPTKQDIYDLAASFQNTAFEHIERVLEYNIKNCKLKIKNLLAGGGVINNIELRKRLRLLTKKHNIRVSFPYTKKLNGDNAAMIGVCAYLKYKNNDLDDFYNYELVDRNPKLKLPPK